MQAVKQLKDVSSVAVKTMSSGRASLSVMTEGRKSILPQIISTLINNGAAIEHVRPKEATLEDVFIAKTGRTLDVDTREIVVRRGGEGGRA